MRFGNQHGKYMPTSSSLQHPAVEPIATSKPDLLAVGAWRENDAMLIRYLQATGHRVSIATQAEQLAGGQDDPGEGPYLALVSLGERPDALQEAAQLKAQGAAAAILLIADPVQSEACIDALDLGADDFVLRPVSQRELLARIRAVWRGREARRSYVSWSDYFFAGYRLDMHRYELCRPDGRREMLSPYRFRLLRAFLNNPGEILSRGVLLAAVSGSSGQAQERSIDIHVTRLRRQLGSKGRDLVRTVHGRGYQFTANVNH